MCAFRRQVHFRGRQVGGRRDFESSRTGRNACIITVYACRLSPHPPRRKTCPRSCGTCKSSEKTKTRKRQNVQRHNKGEGSQGQGEQVCADSDAQCEQWSLYHQCTENPAFMSHTCPRSCELCCTDADSSCGAWAAKGECQANAKYMARMCPDSCKACEGQQRLVHGRESTAQGSTSSRCTDIYSDCARVAGSSPDACLARDFMKENCMKTCGLCVGEQTPRTVRHRGTTSAKEEL